MATVAELLVRIGGDSSGLRREINNSQRQLRRAFGAEALDFSEGAAGVLGAIAAAMGALGIASVSMSSKLNQAHSAFEVLLESGDKATKMVSDLQAYATATSFNFEGLSSTAKGMLAVGIQGQDILPIIASVGDAIGTLGGGTEALQGVIRALSQIQAKGKLSAEEMNQLAERGIPGWKYLAESMGKSTAEVMKMTSDGAINSTTAINAIVSGMATQFKGGAEKANQEMTGQFESMQETAGNIMAQIGNSITKSLDLKNVFSGLNDSLSQFSTAVQSSGIKTAILGLVPPEATAAVFALGGALVAVAIPALYTFAGAMWLAIAPMAPYIALGTAIGLLAYEIWKNWDPLSDLFGGLWNLILNKTSLFLNSLQTGFYTAAKYVMGALAPLANLFGGSFQTTINSWADNAVNKLQTLGDESDDLKTKINSNLKVMGNASKQFNIGLKSLDISNLLPSTPKLNTAFNGLSGGGQSETDDSKAAKAAEAAAKKAERAWEQLEKKADQVSESIEKEWISLIGTQIDALNNWKEDQMRILDESAAANENYQRDMTRLEEIYAEKKKKILSEQQKNTNSIWDKALESAKDYQNRTAKIGMGDGTKQVFEIKTNAEAEFTKIRNEARDTEQSFADLSNESKLQTIQAMTAAGIAFTVSKNGMVTDAKDLASQVNAGAADMSNTQISLAQDTANKTVLIKQESIEKLNALNEAQLNYESDIKKARDQGNLTAYMTALNSENAALTKNLTDRQLIIDTYDEAWRASHKSTTEYMIEGLNGMTSGLTTFFADAISGTSSIGDAWNALGSTVNNVISNMVAEWITGRIKMWAIEKIFNKGGDDTTNKGVAQGTATAAAWWPAAVAVSLATFGANAGPAIGGMTAASLVGMGLGSGFAVGGAVSGPGTGTSDSILSWLSDGEFVFTAATTKALGVDTLNAINTTGKLPGYATGGLVTGRPLSSISSSRYANASLAGNKLISAENKSTNDKSAGDQYYFTISGNDGPSIRKMIMEEGATIVKSLKKQAQGFNTAGVRAT